MVAEARQFVRVVDEPVKLTDDGRAVLADVRRQLSALETQDVSLADLHAAVEAQEARVRTVMRDELVPKTTPPTSPTCSSGACCRTPTSADRPSWLSPHHARPRGRSSRSPTASS